MLVRFRIYLLNYFDCGSMVLVAVDGGKTKTTCIVFDEYGRLISSASAGPSGVLLSPDIVKRNLWSSIVDALSKANLTVDSVKVFSIGLADIDTRKDLERAWSIVRGLSIPPKADVVVEHDAVTAYYAVTYGEPGVSVIAGTGSIAFGMNSRGERARAGGWGWVFGDEGSGYWIAREALQAAAKAYDGRGPATKLLDAFMRHFELTDPIDLMEVVYRVMGGDPTKIAELAVLVDRVAEEGDEIAVDILDRGGAELASACYAVALKLNMVEEPIIVGAVGSVFKSQVLQNSFYSRLRHRLKRARFEKPLVGYEPVVGSAVICFRRLNLSDIQSRVERLKRGLEQINK